MSDKIREAFDAWRSSGSWTRPDDPGEWAAWQAALAQQPAPVAAPEGWKLVPIEPTDEMAKTKDCPVAYWTAAQVYRAMLAASPAAPAPAAQDPDALQQFTDACGRLHSACDKVRAKLAEMKAAEQPGAVKVPREAPTGIKVREILVSISRQARNEACRHGMPRAGQACTFDGIADMADEALRALLGKDGE